MRNGRARSSTSAWVAPAVIGSVALTLALTGCAPRALGFQHDDTIQQGLPISLARSAWGGVDLDNTSDSPITLQNLALTGLDNATLTHVQVIEVTSGNGIGFYYPPLTVGMREEFAHARPLRGFEIPARSHATYEAVFLMSVIDSAEDASSSTVEVTYSAGWSTWTETRHSAYCMFTREGRGCDNR